MTPDPCSMCGKKIKEKNDSNFIFISGREEGDCFFCNECFPKMILEIEKSKRKNMFLIMFFIILALSLFVSPIFFFAVLILGAFYWKK